MIRLDRMTEEEFESAMQESIVEYAKEHVRTGHWVEEGSVERAKREFGQLLPDGLETKGQHVLSIVDEETAATVGVLWYMECGDAARPSVFICELRIFEPHRRKGFATAAMAALETHVRREHGARRIALHTFAHNRAARTLYERLEYRMTNITMAKELD